MELKQLIKKCIKGERWAQKEMYQLYSPVLYAVVKRYVKSDFDAEDVLIETFMKIFNNLSKYRSEGSFEGWIKKIAIRESLMFLRRNKAFNMLIEVDNIVVPQIITYQNEDLEYQDILNVLKLLPVGYRTVFNLYVIEGFKHKEIAEQLGISVNTSKSQLRLVKQRLRKLIKEQNRTNTA